MSAAEVWSYVQFALSVGALVWCLYLHGRLERTEVRLAQTRIDQFALVQVIEDDAANDERWHFSDQLREGFPHLWDVDERLTDERAAERAS